MSVSGELYYGRDLTLYHLGRLLKCSFVSLDSCIAFGDHFGKDHGWLVVSDGADQSSAGATLTARLLVCMTVVCLSSWRFGVCAPAVKAERAPARQK